jgi:multiple sugar transport system substrate-binding protein
MEFMKSFLLVMIAILLLNLTACIPSPSLPTRSPILEVSASDASTNSDALPATVAPEKSPVPSSAFGTFYDLSFVPPEHWPKIGPDPHEGDVPPGELTIAVMDGVIGLKDRAELFMKKHPQVEIIVQDYSEGGTVFDSQKYRSQISTQLMSGEAPDIVDVGMLGFPLIADKGFFVDLYEFIDKDEYIPRETFYQGVLQALETDGKLYRITPYVLFDSFRVREDFIQYLSDETLNKKTLNYRDQIQMFEELSPHLSANDYLIGIFSLGWVFNEVAHQYVDYGDRIATFTNGFSDFLGEVLPWLQTGALEINSSGKFVIDYSLSRGAVFYIPYEDRPYHDAWLRGCVDGNVPFRARNILAISQNSKNPELAWAFIRFLLTDCSDPYAFTMGTSVNRNTFYKMASDPGYVGYLASLGTLSEPIDDLYVDIIDDLYAYSMSASVLMDATSMEYDLMSEIADEVLAGRLTSEEAAERLQERITIMLNE